MEIIDINEKQIKLILHTFLDNFEISDKIDVSESIYNDTNIENWISNKTTTIGGSIVINHLIKNPINNKEKLINRQKKSFEILNYQLKILKENEKDILWILNLKKEIDENSSIKLLFPYLYYLNNLNNHRTFLDIYHIYKIIFVPISCFIYPISIIVTPFFYIKKQLKLNISIHQYIKIFYEILKLMIKPTGNYKKDLFKIISFFIYIFIYIYSIYQTFILSYIIYKMRNKLLEKMKGLINFIKTSITIIKSSNNSWIYHYLYNVPNNLNLDELEKLNYDLSSIFKLWMNEKLKEDILTILKIIYTLDAINVITKLKKEKYWCLPNYSNETKILDIRNPILINNQQPNPVLLEKNLIITGVNAGGKTTYVKSIASNIILSQTFGIINALKGNIIIYDALISIMRIKDEVGISSYFEAETTCCNKMIEIADELSKKGKRGVFILDEPMHSTPPLEAISVAYAITKYLGNLKGISLIITTHFHKLIELEKNKNFINLCVSANKIDGKYIFDYKIKRGGSRQTIAIELLEKHKLKEEIINSAIEFKNKLYLEELGNDR
jgi:DNA mismatch repair ATPase MutS